MECTQASNITPSLYYTPLRSFWRERRRGSSLCPPGVFSWTASLRGGGRSHTWVSRHTHTIRYRDMYSVTMVTYLQTTSETSASTSTQRVNRSGLIIGGVANERGRGRGEEEWEKGEVL